MEKSIKWTCDWGQQYNFALRKAKTVLPYHRLPVVSVQIKRLGQWKQEANKHYKLLLPTRSFLGNLPAFWHNLLFHDLETSLLPTLYTILYITIYHSFVLPYNTTLSSSQSKYLGTTLMNTMRLFSSSRTCFLK